MRSQSYKSEEQKEKGSRTPWLEEKQENKAGIHSACSLSGAGYSRRAQFTSVKLGRETLSGAAGRRAWGAARKVRAPRLAGKARSGLILPGRMDPGGPVGPPAQAPPPKPRPSFRYRPQRQQGTPNTNLSPASKESTQPLLLKKRKKEKCSICQNTTGTLSDCFQPSSAHLPNLENPTGTHRRSRPARRLGRGVGRQAALRTVLGCQPISPKNRNPRRHREVAESPEVDEPLPHVDASGPGGGATLCTPTPWLPGCHPTPALTSAQAAGRRTLPPTAQPLPLP